MESNLSALSVHSLLEFSDEISKYDHRIERCKRHQGRTIAFITLCAVLSGFRGWEEISEYGKCKKSLMEEYLGPLESIPSDDTFRRFFSVLRPENFERVYREWINDVFRLLNSQRSEGNKSHIAIDGKEIRGARESSSLRVVSAYSVDAGISLGQSPVDEKSNEIPALRDLVDELDVSGCIVTADAMHCQKKTCESIIRNGGDFFLFVKGNQQELQELVREAVGVAVRHPRNNNREYSLTDRSGTGNWVFRQCVAVGEPLYLGRLHRQWPWIKSFGGVFSERPGKEGIITEERYFITSLNMDAELFLKTAKNHWGVENGLHWRLDMDFQEDNSRKKRNAALNFSLINKIAISVLACDKKKEPMKRKRQRAALNDQYLRMLLKNIERGL